MGVPLYQAKAELFRNLGHPVRVRALELLLEGPRPVHELLSEIDVEPSNLSQQLAVLRRAGLVTSRREGSTVLYTLSSLEVAEMMEAARAVLTNVISGQQSLLAELASEAGS